MLGKNDFLDAQLLRFLAMTDSQVCDLIRDEPAETTRLDAFSTPAAKRLPSASLLTAHFSAETHPSWR